MVLAAMPTTTRGSSFPSRKCRYTFVRGRKTPEEIGTLGEFSHGNDEGKREVPAIRRVFVELTSETLRQLGEKSNLRDSRCNFSRLVRKQGIRFGSSRGASRAVGTPRCQGARRNFACPYKTAISSST